MAQSFAFHIDWTTLAMLIGLLAILIAVLFSSAAQSRLNYPDYVERDFPPPCYALRQETRLTVISVGIG